MLNRLGLRLSDLAVRQSRDRISDADSLTEQSEELTHSSLSTMSLSRKLIHLANFQTLPSDIKKFKPEVHLHILAKWSDPEIEAFANALIDTYVIAQEWGDTKMEAAAEQALLEIGRYLAKRIVPKAVGYL